MTPEEVRAKLTRGEPISFGVPETPASPEELSRRTIAASWLNELVASTYTYEKPIFITGAVISGPISFEYRRFAAEVVFVGCHFTGTVNLAFAQFSGMLFLDRCTFADRVALASMRADVGLYIAESTFKNAVAANQIKVTGTFFAVGATFQADTVFAGAVIEGLLDCRGCRFNTLVSFDSMNVTGVSLFSISDTNAATVFRGGAEFSGVIFGGRVDFRSAEFHKEALFLATEFRSHAGFFGVQFHGDALFDSARVEGSSFFGPSEVSVSRFGGRAGFRNASFAGPVIFNQAAFAVSAEFGSVDFGSDASFSGVIISGEARFDGAAFGGTAHFDPVASQKGNARYPVIFKMAAYFIGCQFVKQANFTDVKFFGAAVFAHSQWQAEVAFGGAEFLGEAVFDSIVAAGPFQFTSEGNPARFGENARFGGASVGGQASFHGVTFEKGAVFARARFKADILCDGTIFSGAAIFDGARIEGPALFRARDGRETRFRSEANFESAVFSSRANFHGAAFDRDARFAGARFLADGWFQNVTFGGDCELMSVMCTRVLNFENALFKGALVCRDARIDALVFRASLTRDIPENERSQFDRNTYIDLTGCEYGRLGGSWREIADHSRPYERTVYTRLEKTLLAAGHVRDGQDAYLLGRSGDRRQLWRSFRQWPRASVDTLWWLIARYGVRPYQLFVYLATVLVLGTAVFHAPGAMEIEERGAAAKPVAQLSLTSAAGVSLHEFLPITVRSGGRYAPRSVTVDVYGLAVPVRGYATFHRLLGLILVPLTIAWLSGLLHRPIK